MNRGVFFIGIFAFVCLSATCVCPAFAGDPWGEPAWTDPSYVPCGQSCLYQRSNEHIIVDTIYSEAKVRLLEGASSATVLANLKDFCLPNEGGGECYTRYKEIVYQHLGQAASAMDHNTMAADSLNKPAGGVAFDANQSIQKKAQVTTISTVTQMEQIYDHKKKQTPPGFVGDAYIKTVVNHAPRAKDFPDSGAYMQALQDYNARTEKMRKDASAAAANTKVDQPPTLEEAAGADSMAAYKWARGLAIKAAQDKVNGTSTKSQISQTGGTGADRAVAGGSVLSFDGEETVNNQPKAGVQTSVFGTMNTGEVRNSASKIRPVTVE